MHKKAIYLFCVGEAANCFPKGDVGQNLFLDTEVANVGSNISLFEHCTNFLRMEKLENTLVMSEIPTEVCYLACTITTRRMSI